MQNKKKLCRYHYCYIKRILFEQRSKTIFFFTWLYAGAILLSVDGILRELYQNQNYIRTGSGRKQ